MFENTIKLSLSLRNIVSEKGLDLLCKEHKERIYEELDKCKACIMEARRQKTISEKEQVEHRLKC